MRGLDRPTIDARLKRECQSFDLGEFASLLPKLTKFQIEVEKSWNVYTVSKTVPDSPICQAP
jgi:hypothetical protein